MPAGAKAKDGDAAKRKAAMAKPAGPWGAFRAEDARTQRKLPHVGGVSPGGVRA